MALLLLLCFTCLVLCASYVPPAELPEEEGAVQPADEPAAQDTEEPARPAAEAAPEPERFFRTPWLRRQLRGVKGALTRRGEGWRQLALPYDPRKPYPLVPMFCLSRIRRLGEERYVIYTFDRQEWPIPGPEKN